MSNLDVIRAWKDEDYRLSLSDEQLSLLPDNPAGLMELSDADLASIVGGSGNSHDSNNDSKDDTHHDGDTGTGLGICACSVNVGIVGGC
jgi:mersacidin/lichenicidin family type 2 lantibiotic